MTLRLPALLCLLFLLTGIRGQELSLEGAFDFDKDPTVEPTPHKELKPTPHKELNPTVKPGDDPKPATAAPKPDGGPKPATTAPKSVPKADDDMTPTKKTQPGHGGGGGGGSFSDADLVDGDLNHDDNSGSDGRKSGGEEEGQGQEKQSVIAGVVSALGVAAVGAISSFIAYQKKKLCFKGQAEDPENVNMDNQKGDQNDPQVQTNLLSK